MIKAPPKSWTLAGALTIFLLLLCFHHPQADRPEVGRMAAVAVLMSMLWITEAIPLAATSLIPLVALPLLGILDSGKVASTYMNSIVFLYVGGFLLALAMEKWNLHRRMALVIVSRTGSRPAGLVFGFMAATALISMWISNTATTVMMLPIGMAIIRQMELSAGRERTHRLSVCLLLGIAYASSIGGVSTLVGSPTNLIMVRILAETFPAAPPVTFGQWILLGLPFSILLLLLAWLLLTRVLFRLDQEDVLSAGLVKKELAALGKISPEEQTLLAIFGSTVFLWIFRQDIALGFITIPGWSRCWSGFGAIDDGTIAIAAGLLLFLLPRRFSGREWQPLCEAEVFRKLPWDIVLLFGGGFALSQGFTASGLSRHIGESLQIFAGIPLLWQIVGICLITTFLTELTSNVATLTMLLPVLLSWAVGSHLHPLLFAIPATISASMAFMLPVATPPNAVVFGSGYLRIPEMVRAGWWLNLTAIPVTAFLVLLLFERITGVPATTFPGWATAP